MMRRGGLILLLFLAVCPSAEAVGPYLDFGKRPPITNSPAVFIGDEGVPKVDYRHTSTPWLGVQDNPVTVAHWALQAWSWGDQQPVLTAADWYLAHQRADGAWTYSFPFSAHGVQMDPPWISAMAQGQAISVLVRAHETTGEQSYLDAAVLALDPFTRSVAEGGVTELWDGLPWYEEYPGVGSQHVLNGFQFALIGLHDLAPRSPLAADLWTSGIDSLAAHIGWFDQPRSRTQLYAAFGQGRRESGASYKHEHTILTQEMFRLDGRQVFADYAARWQSYERPLPVAQTVKPLKPQARRRCGRWSWSRVHHRWGRCWPSRRLRLSPRAFVP